MSKYSDIIERLEKASGSNFALDRDIHKLVAAELSFPPPYTASLDLSVALAGRLLPMHAWLVEGGYGSAESGFWSKATILETYKGASPSIALLLAMFKALQAQEESEAE